MERHHKCERQNGNQQKTGENAFRKWRKKESKMEFFKPLQNGKNYKYFVLFTIVFSVFAFIGIVYYPPNTEHWTNIRLFGMETHKLLSLRVLLFLFGEISIKSGTKCMKNKEYFPYLKGSTRNVHIYPSISLATLEAVSVATEKSFLVPFINFIYDKSHTFLANKYLFNWMRMHKRTKRRILTNFSRISNSYKMENFTK